MEEQVDKLWDELPFIGFNEDVLQERKGYWYQYAQEILTKLQFENVALVADTAAGKTIITILVMSTGNFRCLFLAPSRYLCGQHQKLFRQITGGDITTRVITGVSPKRERFWNYPWEKVIFSTPHMAVNEVRRGKLDLRNFGLVVVDEFHKASGQYPYTNITRRLNKKTKILALSASPGDNLEKIKEVEKNCKIRDRVIADIPTPTKARDLVMAEQDETIRIISDCLDGLLKNVLGQINELMPALRIDLDKEHLFGFTETEKWREKASTLDKEKEHRTAQFLIAKYIKLYHCYSVIIKEGYATFLEYTATLKTQNASSSRNILAQRDFLRVINMAQKNIDDHPKGLMLLKVLKQWTNLRKNAIVFVGQRATGAYLKKFLNDSGIRADNIHGGGGKAALQKQKEALAGLARGDLKAIISTSVIEEGVSVPEVNMIIHYSRPSTGTGSKQRDGRTGRLAKGNIVHLVMDHPLDKTEYWIGQNKVKQGEKALREHSRRKQIQLSLFPEEE